MTEYHKINTIFKRDMTNKGMLQIGEYSLPVFEYLRDNDWVFTEKVDGTNVRVMWDGKRVSFNGKTDNAQMPMPLVTKLQELFEGTAKRQLFIDTFGGLNDPEEDMEVCLYGEGYGAKIQKGGGNYMASGVDFVLFDVKVSDWWLQREDVEDVASCLGIKAVPVIGHGTLHEAVELARSGFNSEWGNFPAEGIVLRPSEELRTRNGQRIITKIKHCDFHL